MNFKPSNRVVSLRVIDTLKSKGKQPTTAQKVKGFAKFAGGAVKTLFKDGRLLAEKDLIAKRLRICNTCDYLDRDNNRCSKCGCSKSGYLRNKLIYKASYCPERFW